MDAKKHFWVDYLACLFFGVAIAPLWFLVKNYPCFDVGDAFFLMAIFGGIHVFCFVGFRLFLKEKEKRLLFCYFAWSLFWYSLEFARKFAPFCRERLPLVFHYRWILAVVLSLMILLVFGVFLKRGKSSSVVNRVIGRFSYVLFFFLLSQIVVKVYSRRLDGHNSAKIATYFTGQFPNIYCILCDAHPNAKGFEQIGGDLSFFYSELNKLGFMTYPESRSVFSSTGVSVPAMWFMEDSVHLGISESPVLKTLEQVYTLRFFMSSTVVAPIYFGLRDWSWYKDCMLYFYFLSTKTPLYPFLASVFHRQLADSWKRGHRYCLRGLEEWYGPCNNFYYAHILSPHPPFVYESSNNYSLQGLKFDEDHWFFSDVDKMKRLVRAETHGIDIRVLATIKTILEQYRNRSIKPIIILFSDHGSVRDRDMLGVSSYATVDTIWGNLFAIYMPDEWKKDAKDLKFINLYRFIFNHLFGTNYEYLSDLRQNADGSIFEERTLSSSER